MALTNNSTTQVSISGLTYNNLLEDLYNAIQDNDEFKNSFSDFTSAEAVRLLAEMYCYVAEQLANRIDIIGRELFVDTASVDNLARLLKLINYKLEFPSSSEVGVNISMTKGSYTGRIILLSKGINYNNEGETLNPEATSLFYGFTANNKHFEFIIKDSTTGKYNYLRTISFTAPSEKMYVYEGTTNFQTYTIGTLKKQTLTISGPVEKNSVRIYYRNKEVENDTYVPVELTEVDNFFSREALTATRGYYTARNLGSGTCEIMLQPGETDLGSEIIIMYRTTSGSAGNVSIGSINVVQSWDSASNIKIYNYVAGAGGVDELTSDEIRNSVPQEIRNAYVPVSEEDYEYLFPSLDSKIKFVKAYGEKTKEATALASTYGYYVNPLNIWLLILKQNETFSEAYLTLEGLTDYVNDICFQILDLNPRFNEKYQVHLSSVGDIITAEDLTEYFDTSTNTYTIPATTEGNTAFSQGDCDIILTKRPYVESADTSGLDVFSESDCIYDFDDTSNYYVEQDANTLSSFTTITSSLTKAYESNNWDTYKSSSDKVTFSTDVTVNITINGDETEFIIPAETYSKDALAETINDGLPQTTQMVRLKTDISNTPASTTQFNLENQKHGNLTFYIQKNGETSKTAFTVLAQDTDNYGDVRDRINEKFETAGIDDEYLAVIFRENDCATLAIVSSNKFTFSEKSDEYTNQLGYYTHYLQNEDSGTSASITSEEFDIPSAYYTIWPAYSNATIAVVSETTGKIELRFDTSVDDPSLKVESDSDMFNDIFEIDGYSGTIYQKRKITCKYSATSNIGYITIRVCSIKDLISFPIYISIFGKSSSSLSLGDYYTNIDSYLPNEDTTIRNLLRRDPIVNLYSTKFTVDDSDNSVEDYYSCEYEVKFTSGKINESTYNQIGNGDSTAKLISAMNPDKLVTFATTDVLYMRVDGIDFSNFVGSDFYKTIWIDGVSKNVYCSSATSTRGGLQDPYSGYARIYLSWFNNKTVSEMLNYFIDIFKNYDSQTQTNTYYLKKISTDEYVGLETVSATYVSSIDLNGTDSEIATGIFDIEDSLISKSEEGVITPTQINYKLFGLLPSKKYVMSKNLTITCKVSGVTYSGTANTGFGINSLKQAIDSNGSINPFVTLENNKIAFKSLHTGDEIAVSVAYTDWSERDDLKKMFVDTFVDTAGSGYTGTLSLTKKNSGDYYIYKYVDERGNISYPMIIEDVDKFPIGDIYMHMYEDYQNDHVVSTLTNGDNIYTDEYSWASLLEDRKMMMANHIFKQPRFVPFDLNVTCYIPNTIGINMIETYKEYVTDYLREAYNIYNAPINANITTSKIILNIKSNVPNIVDVDVNYLGEELTEESIGYIKTDFNQKAILSSNKFVTKNNVTTQTHGLIVSVKYNNTKE